MEINIHEITEKAIQMKSLSFKIEIIQALNTLKQFQSMKDIKEINNAVQEILRSC